MSDHKTCDVFTEELLPSSTPALDANTTAITDGATPGEASVLYLKDAQSKKNSKRL